MTKESKVVGCTVMFPPNDNNAHSIPYTSCYFMKRMLSLPKGCQNERAAAIETWMSKCHHECIGKTRHWYIQCFAVDPKEQGKGYGRELFEVRLREGSALQVMISLPTHCFFAHPVYAKGR